MTALHLAGPDDLERLLPQVQAFQEDQGIARRDEDRIAALMPLLQGSPHGVVYLFGPQRAPIGHVVISFGWSLEYGGLTGIIDEIFVRPSVRGRGIGSEVLTALPKALAGAGLKALHLELHRDDEKTRRFFAKLRFGEHSDHMLMTLEC
ncbi:putative acetyltransferase [Thalassovita gelatinovora]|uniref:Putative acetyltransferase n=1 Tax=Thalassovita gelatinovora TaxID=53501 RepID=A0A0P1F4L8_THAGE|nr:GNAT family N-acetyltransferase [Thalassovita gelatinovora]QIZ79402.1 GNAT family N-acetyltransferase [Thalassovita gelatinovora]CUH62733.1 putative acetyltransferase [Thalassovita gelatinovora]SEQ09294.1 Acetyltransferase (GNAT) family protein [Thalassovita gelatinovora]